MAQQNDEAKDEDRDKTLLPGYIEMIGAAVMSPPNQNIMYGTDESQSNKGTSMLTLCEISFNT